MVLFIVVLYVREVVVGTDDEALVVVAVLGGGGWDAGKEWNEKVELVGVGVIKDERLEVMGGTGLFEALAVELEGEEVWWVGDVVGVGGGGDSRCSMKDTWKELKMRSVVASQRH
jgi:hypothetical protein